MLPNYVLMAILASMGSAVVPDTFVTSYATYAAGLAAVAEGQSFAAPIDSNRDGVWLRTSGVGVMTGCQPHDQTTGLVRPTVASTGSLPGTGLLIDIDAVDGLWGIDEILNRAPGAASPASINLLWKWNGGATFSKNGDIAQTLSQVDSQGGTSAVRLQYAAGAQATSDVIFIKTVPPGQWTWQFDAVSNNGATQAWQMGTNSTTGMVPISITTTRQTFTGTFTLTTATSRLLTLMQGSYPAVAASAGDIIIENVRLVPGPSAQVGVQDQSLRVGYWQTNLTSSYTGTAITGNAAGVLAAKLPALTTLTSYTLAVAGNFSRPTGTSALLYAASPAVTVRLSYLGQNMGVDATNSQTVDGLTYNNGSNVEPQFKVSNVGMQAHVLRVQPSGIDYFVDGQLMHSTTGTSAITSASFLTLLGAISSAAAANWNATGTISGVALWNTAIDSEAVTAVTTKMLARVTAKSLSKQATRAVYIAEGDSITAATGDTSNGTGGYVNRGHDLLTTPYPPMRNEGVFGATLMGGAGNSLYGAGSRQAADTALIAGYIAHGWTPVLSFLIGTNDSQGITTQAQAEAYYANLVAYSAAMRTAGAKVLACTQIPCNTSTAAYPYDRNPVTIVGGAFNGNTYNGLRNYIRAMMLAAPSAFDGIADFGGNAAFTSYSATYFGDVAHPNALGHSVMASILGPALQAVVNSI